MKKSEVPCVYCGNNPVNHQILWIAQSVQFLSSPLLAFFEKRPLKIGAKIRRKIITVTLGVLALVKIVRFSDKVEDSLSDRSKVIWLEAEKRDLKIQQVQLLGVKGESFRVLIKNRWHYFNSLPLPDSSSGAQSWLDDKWLLKRFLLKNKIPTPRGLKSLTLKSAKQAFEKLDKPLVVKPTIGSRGRHTTTYLYELDDFLEAYKQSKKICVSVSVDEMLLGSVYRATVVNGECVAVLKGDFPRVNGDGKQSISSLIQQKNSKRPKGIGTVKITESLGSIVERQGYSLESIPKAGISVNLSEKVGVRYGGDAMEVSAETHPKIKTVMAKLGQKLGVEVLGIDFIIPEISQDPDKQKWGIIEANSLPFIDLHHFPRLGKPVNVAKHVWDSYLKSL